MFVNDKFNVKHFSKLILWMKCNFGVDYHCNHNKGRATHTGGQTFYLVFSKFKFKFKFIREQRKNKSETHSPKIGQFKCPRNWIGRRGEFEDTNEMQSKTNANTNSYISQGTAQNRTNQKKRCTRNKHIELFHTLDMGKQRQETIQHISKAKA